MRQREEYLRELRWRNGSDLPQDYLSLRCKNQYQLTIQKRQRFLKHLSFHSLSGLLPHIISRNWGSTETSMTSKKMSLRKIWPEAIAGCFKHSKRTEPKTMGVIDNSQVIRKMLSLQLQMRIYMTSHIQAQNLSGSTVMSHRTFRIHSNWKPTSG